MESIFKAVMTHTVGALAGAVLCLFFADRPQMEVVEHPQKACKNCPHLDCPDGCDNCACEGKGGRLVVKEIEAQRVVVRSPGGKRTITLTTSNDLAGIWISEADGTPCAAMVSQRSGQFIGLMPAKMKKGCSFAIAQDGGGDPYLQIIPPDGKIRIIDGAKLLKLGD